MQTDQLSITCPLCGRRNEHSLTGLREGEDLVCPSCGVKLNLHGHMWQEIQNQIADLKKEEKG
jgi:DNA-directed RNA polymerase subunit RPC12/RpoP